MWPVAGGAALLFLTNLVAIIFVGTLSFVGAGFNRVNSVSLERDELTKSQNAFVTAAIARRLSLLFASKAGPALRFLMPLVLLAVVYLPLRRALDEVAWQVRVRAAVQDALTREPREIVQSRVRVERHEVDLRVVLLGNTADGEACRGRLDTELKSASGVMPRIEVLAIPDATAFAGLQSTLRSSQDPLLPLTPPPPSAAQQLDIGRSMIRTSVRRLWPAAAAGEAIAIEVGTSESGPLRVRVVHLGAALGSDAVESLGRGLVAALSREVQIVDVAIPTEALTRSSGDLALVSRVSAGIRATAAIVNVNLCVVEPGPPLNRRRVDKRDQELADTLRQVLAEHPRVTTEVGDDWSVRFVRGACTTAVD